MEVDIMPDIRLFDKAEAISFSKKKVEYNENQQPQGVRFSMLDSKLNELFPPVLCRDYLCDVIYCEEKQKPIEVYGFNYQPISKDRLYRGLLVQFGTSKLIDAFNNFLPLFWIIENRNNIANTAIQRTERENVFLFHTSDFWFRTPPLMSLYSWLIRLGTYPIEFDDKSVVSWFKALSLYPNRTRELMTVSYYRNKLEYWLRNLPGTLLLRYSQEYNKVITEYERQGDPKLIHNALGILSWLDHKEQATKGDPEINDLLDEGKTESRMLKSFVMDNQFAAALHAGINIAVPVPEPEGDIVDEFEPEDNAGNF